MQIYFYLFIYFYIFCRYLLWLVIDETPGCLVVVGGVDVVVVGPLGVALSGQISLSKGITFEIYFF